MQTMKAAFQAQKTLSAREQRKFCIFRMHNRFTMQRNSAGIITLRPDWEKLEVRLMYRNLHVQVMQNPELRDKTATGESTLVEGNNWGDLFLGGKVNNCWRKPVRNHPDGCTCNEAAVECRNSAQ